MRISKSFLVPLIACIGLGAAPVAAAPALWEISDSNSSIWIFGSFHILPPEAEWRTELFDNLLAEADSVVFEADVRPSAVALVGASAFTRGIYTDGSLLTDVLSPEDERALRDVLDDIGLPMGSILAMRPWMATNTITLQALASAGFVGEGVELLVQPQVGDRLGFLESGDEQIDVLANAPLEEQVAMLGSTLSELDALPKMMHKMLRSWVAGTPESLSNLFLMEMGGFEEAFLERLIYARNRNWMTSLEEMLADDQENLVIVGAAHLIGDGSVIDLLETAGYTVQRVQ